MKRDEARANAAMQRYSLGDDSAFRDVYEVVAPRILAFARRCLRDAILAWDIVQQTFLQIHQARAVFMPGAKVMPWAYVIARRLVVDALRSRLRDRRLAHAGTPLHESGAIPDQALEAKQTITALQLTFAALPESQRTVLELRDRGMTLADLSRILATTVTTVTTVKLRIHRARMALRHACRWNRHKAASNARSAPRYETAVDRLIHTSYRGPAASSLPRSRS